MGTEAGVQSSSSSESLSEHADDGGAPTPTTNPRDNLLAVRPAASPPNDIQLPLAQSWAGISLSWCVGVGVYSSYGEVTME